MSHPFANLRQSKVERSRATDMTKDCYAGGGAVSRTAAKSVAKSTAKSKAMKIDGKHAAPRLDKFARGGKVKGKGATNVNVIIAPQGGGAGAGAGAAMMPKPPLPAMPPPPMAGPPGMPPGAGAGGPPMPPGMMPHARGGRANYAKGGKVKSGNGPAWAEGIRNGTQVQHTDGKDDRSGLGRGKPVTYAKGGGIPMMGRAINPATAGWKAPSSMRTATASPMPKMPKVKMGKTKFATGGPVEAGTSMGPKMTAGDNGVGRLEKSHIQRLGKYAHPSKNSTA